MSDDTVDPPMAGLAPPRESTSVVGHDDAIARIESSWRSGRMHHAIMLTGRRGIGKATLAYAIARMVLERGTSLAGASVGTAQRQIAQGAAQQFRRLARSVTREGKLRSVITVDDVRALEPFLRQRAERDAWRVVLVDAVDDMNGSSANALLKVLEEPGERTLFLLVVHHDGAILPTIRSRCLTYRLQPLTDPQMRAVLEPSTLDPGRLDRAIGLADGSARRALALAEKGGIETVEGVARVLDKPVWAAGDAQLLADGAGGRDGEPVFEEIAVTLPDILAKRALELARSGDLGRAKRLSELGGTVAASIRQRDEYGVDRRLVVRSALSEAHRVLHE